MESDYPGYFCARCTKLFGSISILSKRDKAYPVVPGSQVFSSSAGSVPSDNLPDPEFGTEI